MATKKTRKPREAPVEAHREAPPMRKVIEEPDATGEEIRYKLFDIRNLTEGIRLVATTMGDDSDDLKHVIQTAARVASEKVDEVLRDLEINGAFEDDEAAA